MNIGNNIKILRKQRGITQEQLAESIGISFQAVSKWGEQHRPPRHYPCSRTGKLFRGFHGRIV